MIGAKRVTAPDGTTWRVGRRWLPEKPTLWRRERRRGNGDGGSGDWFPDLGFGGVDEGLVIAGVVLVVVLVLLLLTFVLLPVLVLLLELLLVVVLLLGGLAGRLLLRKPWTIRARSGDGRELTWRASGWRRSGRVRDDAAAALALGHADVRPSEALEGA